MLDPSTRPRKKHRLPINALSTWRLPPYGYHPVTIDPLTLDELQSEQEQAWIRDWITRMKSERDFVAAPVQLYPGKLRRAQGYLARMAGQPRRRSRPRSGTTISATRPWQTRSASASSTTHTA